MSTIFFFLQYASSDYQSSTRLPVLSAQTVDACIWLVSLCSGQCAPPVIIWVTPLSLARHTAHSSVDSVNLCQVWLADLPFTSYVRFKVLVGLLHFLRPNLLCCSRWESSPVTFLCEQLNATPWEGDWKCVLLLPCMNHHIETTKTGKRQSSWTGSNNTYYNLVCLKHTEALNWYFVILGFWGT